MIDEELQNAYQNAVYRLFAPSISWKVGQSVPRMNELLTAMKVQSATFITAHNPGSVLLSPQENEDRQHTLRQLVEEHSWKYLKGQGEDPKGLWPAEASLLVLGINDAEALMLARRFQQNAVVMLDLNGPARLLIDAH